MLFNDAVLNRMEFYINEVVETAIPFGGMYPNNFECEYMARWRYEKDCLDRFNHLLGLMDKNELSDFELYNLQALCFNILDVSIQKGFFDGAEELLKRIGLGLIEREDVQIEGKEYLVFFFDVQNISDEIQYISDFDFTGYVDGYEIEVEYIYNDIDGIGDLDATLKPYKRSKGYVAFEVEETWKSFEIRYSDWFDDTELVFRIINEDNSSIQGA